MNNPFTLKTFNLEEIHQAILTFHEVAHEVAHIAMFPNLKVVLCE